MAKERLDSVMKAPEKWGVKDWTVRFNTLFTFLCSEEIEELTMVTGMDPKMITMEIEQLLIALVVHGMDKGQLDEQTIQDRRKLLLSSIKGMERYSQFVEVAHVLRQIVPKDTH